jgi:hypothetical protein
MNRAIWSGVVVSLLCFFIAGPALGQVFDPDVHGTGLSLADYMRPVPGGGQPDGPAYGFSMGQYEITNGQFAAFLNDAQLDGGASGRGSNMFFDTDGRVRTAAGGPTLFRAAPGAGISRINYDPAAPLGLRYSVRTINGVDQNTHPVTFVSWLGAVKFSNWLTIDQGLGESQRVYSEGPNVEAWHPLSISTADWQARDLSAAERQSLVDNFRGFRLPMDDQSQTASAFNEFYKAAAWDPAAGVNRLYGFGRDAIDVQDANFNIDDPFAFPRNPFHDDGAPNADWTNPVGFFDGSLQQKSNWNWPSTDLTFQTRLNENAFDIFDLSGNLWELQQDKWPDASGNVIFRGGHFGLDETSAQTDSWSPIFPTTTGETRGFRLVQVPEPTAAFYSIFAWLLYWCCGGKKRGAMSRPIKL